MTNALLLLALAGSPDLEGPWRGALDLAGGELRFAITLSRSDEGYGGTLCNAASCSRFSSVTLRGDSLVLEMADYAATIVAATRGDSLTGFYRNVGNRGPRVIPFRAARGTWPRATAPAALLGSWDATFDASGRTSPRVLLFQQREEGLQGTVLSNTGDYGVFSGRAAADSFALSHFDGSFVYLLTGRVHGDSLRGIFHAGLSTQTPFTAVRSTGAPHLRSPTEMTRADTTAPFRFSFPSVDGGLVRHTDERFRGKVVLIDIFGTWCPTCHDAAPVLTGLWRRYHDRGLEIVGIAYEVSGDTAVDGALVRRYREKFDIPFPLLLGGINVVEETAATLPQLDGFGSYPTTIFLGRDGRVRRVHAGFYGPVTGERHTSQLQAFHAFIERLLEE